MLNGVQIKGDDQPWKRQVEKEINDLKNQINILKSVIKYLEGK